jgi:hypothetical protein
MTVQRFGEPIEQWSTVQTLAETTGVTCLDIEWRGRRHKYLFRCESGHTWERRGDRLRERPLVCQMCRRLASIEGRRDADVLKATLTIVNGRCKTENLEIFRELARVRGGMCLTPQYTKLADLYAFRCAAGHEWSMRGHRMLLGSWCAPCEAESLRLKLRLPDGLERLKSHAQEKGGECLSGEYLGLKARYRFRCAKDHEWACTGVTALGSDAWCRTCVADALRLSIDDAHEAARARGGQCLSEHYVHSHIKLAWRCDRGHEWQAALNTIRRGHWCSQCVYMARISDPKSKARQRYGDAGAKLHGAALLNQPAKDRGLV